MDLLATEEIAVPISRAWAEVTNFEQFEAGLRKREVELERQGDGAPRTGTAWLAEFPFAGRKLKAEARIAELIEPTLLRLEGHGTGIDGVVQIRLTEIDAGHTRVEVATGLKARAIGAQVILQPLRLARGKLQTQLDEQVARIGRAMERRHVEQVG